MLRLAFCLIPCVFLSPEGATVRLAQKDARLLLSGDGFSADRKLRLSGELTLTCVVDGPDTLEVSAASIEPDSKLWEVLGRATNSARGPRWQQSITLAPTQPGSLSLPAVIVRYRAGPGKEWTMVRWDDLRVEVIGPPPDQANAIRGEMTPESIPEPPVLPGFPVLWLVLGLAGGAALATGVMFLLRRPRGEITLPPRERALRDLERLRGETQPHARLSLIVRTHVEECLGFPATRQTTEEVLSAVRKQEGVGEEVWRDLETLLAECDRVNFAGADTTPEERERLLALARDWVERTSPVTAAESGT